MSNKVIKFCKKCKTDTSHRLVKDKRSKNYHSCAICLENNSKIYRNNHRLRYLAQKANSRKKPNSEKMTEEILLEIYHKQGKCCSLSGMPFDIERTLYKPSLDRIDSSKGYVRGNIQLVLFIVNKMKRELVEFEFMSVCFNIADNFKNNYAPHLFDRCQE